MPKVRDTECIQKLFCSISWAFISLHFFFINITILLDTRAIPPKSQVKTCTCTGYFWSVFKHLITSSLSSAKNVAVFSGQLNLVPVIPLMGLSLYTDTDNFSIMLLDCYDLCENNGVRHCHFTPTPSTLSWTVYPPTSPFASSHCEKLLLCFHSCLQTFDTCGSPCHHFLYPVWGLLFHCLAKNREREKEQTRL